MLPLCTAKGAGVIPYFAVNKEFLEQLKADFSEFRFINGKKFAFRPPRTIVLGPPEPFSELLLLHEVAHAVLKHKTFRMDVERLRMESEAWDKARDLANRYNIDVNEDLIQDELDTYRDWLHARSKCKKCGLTCYQTSDGAYHCPRCENFA